VTLEAVFFNKRAEVCLSVLSGVENDNEDDQDTELHCGKGERVEGRHQRGYWGSRRTRTSSR
jgi:hypothetical protein